MKPAVLAIAVFLAVAAYWKLGAVSKPLPATVAAATAPASSGIPTPASTHGTGRAPEAPVTLCEQCGERASAAPHAHAPDLKAVDAFAAWSGRFLAADSDGSRRADLLAEGLALAEARLPVMEALLRANPRRALEVSVRHHEWAAYPEALRALVERPFSGAGDYEVRAVCDVPAVPRAAWETRFITVAGETYYASVYGDRRAHLSKLSIPVQGVVLNGVAALWEEAVLPVSGAEEAAVRAAFTEVAPTASVATGEPGKAGAVSALVGGGVVTFANQDELHAHEARLAAYMEVADPYSVQVGLNAAAPWGWAPPSPGSVPPTGTSGWANTPKTQLVLRVVFAGQATSSFPYTQAQLAAAWSAVSSTYQSHSYGRTRLDTTVSSQVLVLANPIEYYATPPTGVSASARMRTDARAAAVAAGYVLGNYHMIAYWHPEITGAAWTAPAFANLQAVDSWYKGDQGSRTQSIIMHESGHNYGLGHANGWNGYTGTGFESAKGGAENDEYGDPFDLMAADFGAVNGLPLQPNGHFSMSEKSYLRWLDAEDVHTGVTSGAYRIFRFDHADAQSGAGKLALRVFNANGDAIWVGLRQNFPASASAAHIVWAFNANQHRLVDTSPLSTPGQSLGTDRLDASLQVGRTWEDPTRSVRITTLAAGGSAPYEYIDVQVSLVDRPTVEYFTTAAETTPGLIGRYFDANLATSTDVDWSDGSPVVSGSRTDNPAYFPGNGWGARADVGLTSGTDANWENFSVQWDGWVRVHRPMLIATRSDDSSRLWIDRDGNGSFSADELGNNNWGFEQGTTVGTLLAVHQPGLYRMRVQYEEGGGGNTFALVSTPFLFQLHTEPSLATPGLEGSYFNQSFQNSSDTYWADGPVARSGVRVEYPLFPGNGWGVRGDVGLTAGTDADWNTFSAEWNGVIRTGPLPLRFATASDAGSRFWIDTDSNGNYDSNSTEFAQNLFAAGGSAVVGPLVGPLPASSTRWTRIQYFENTGSNSMHFYGVPVEAPDDHGGTRDVATLLPSTDGSLQGALGAGDTDVFQIEIPGPGLVRIYSTSGMDTVGRLTDAAGLLLAENDDADGSYNRNFEIATVVSQAGSYFLEVVGYSSSYTGPYQIVTEFIPHGALPLGTVLERASATSTLPLNRLVTPVSVVQTLGDSIQPDFTYANLINNSGLNPVPNPNASDYLTSTHVSGYAAGTWATNSGFSPRYFDSALPTPQFVFNLGTSLDLHALVIWGYAGIANEASDFRVEFSEDGGATYRRDTIVATSALVGTGVATLYFDRPYRANTVRLTITQNAAGRGFPGPGGDRVGLAEVKFLGTGTRVPWGGFATGSVDNVDAARSGDISHGEESAFELSFEGPGVLSWWWRVSSESVYDVLSVTLNGVEVSNISGEVDWNQRLLNLPAGVSRIAWRYSKDGSADAGDDAGWVDQVHFEPADNGGLDAPRQALLMGEVPWFNQSAVTFDGVDAMQSGDIGDNGVSHMGTTVVGPATLTFRWKVSSELNFDALAFSMAGTERARISGEADWQPVEIDVPAGSHFIAWSYFKDETLTNGQDTGWVDAVSLTSAGLRPSLSAAGPTGLQLRFATLGAATFDLEYSTNLRTWQRSLSELPATGAETTVNIPAALVPLRPAFFRVVLTPAP